MQFSRRDCLNVFASLAVAPHLAFPQTAPAPSPAASQPDSGDAKDWSCPMDPDIHLDQPGKCPRCGMTLVLRVPDRAEFPVRLRIDPPVLQPNTEAVLTLTIVDPANKPVRHFELVHEKLMHLFVVSEDLSFFQHVHPVPQPDGTFTLAVRPPVGGMYRLLADYYPAGSVPQLALATFFVNGNPGEKQLPTSTQLTGANMSAVFHVEPQPVLAGFESRLLYRLDPIDGFERYLGAWGHMLVASEDLVDLIHLHPFLVNGSDVQFNAILPRPGKYKIWAQFQRSATVNTFAFCVEAKTL